MTRMFTLRLLQTTAGVRQKKIIVCALFSMKPQQTIHKGNEMKNLIIFFSVLGIAHQND